MPFEGKPETYFLSSAMIGMGTGRDPELTTQIDHRKNYDSYASPHGIT